MRGFISDSSKDEIIAKTDIVSLVGEYVELSQRGADWWGCCPFHNEKTPSFSVSPSKRMFYCFGCHTGGNAVNFLMKMENLSYPDALELAARKGGVQIVYEQGYSNKERSGDSRRDEFIELYERVAGTFHYMLTQTEAGRFALDYILSRGISMETVQKFKLGYAPGDGFWLKKFLLSKSYSGEFLEKSGLFSRRNPDRAFFSDRLLFPIFDRAGKAVAFGGRILRGEGPKYLNSGDLVQYKKGGTLYAFNFAKQAIREAKAVIFCEGYMDVIAYHQCGICNAVAPLGTALTEEQLRLIQGFADTVLLSFDSDGAGREATKRAILMCRRASLGVRIIRLEGGKDPAEIAQKFGAESLTLAVKNAILDSDFLLSALLHEYPNDSPENKAKASLAFFPYVDALRSDVQKSSSLELLCQAYGLRLESVQKDFYDQNRVRSRLIQKNDGPPQDKAPRVVMDAELRTMMAVIADTSQFAGMKSQLTGDDFSNPFARQLFLILSECDGSDSLSAAAVLDRCEDESVRQKVAEVVSSQEFSGDTSRIVGDGIRLLLRNRLGRRREELLSRIRNFSNSAVDDGTLQALLLEKVRIDGELKRLKEKNESDARTE